ncbi:dNA polymerase III subunit beta [Clostridium sp. CAG:768]|nr:dNA polymerase III subunit beta [Clostridium sp. CAG:768]
MKNSNKAKREIRIEINKSVLKKIIKSHKNFASKYEISSILANFHFELANNHLEIASTDGNRLLISTIEVNNPNNDFCSFNVNGGLLSKLVIFKGSVIDWLEVVILKDSIQFNDNEFGIRQEFKLVEAQFPKYKQLIPDYGNENFAIGLNSQFFKDLSSLEPNERTNIIIFNFNKENNLKPVLVDTGSPELKQKALLMPVQIR